MEKQIPSSAAEIKARLETIGHAQTQELARISGVPFTTLWKIRTGETSNPRVETVGQFFHLIDAIKSKQDGVVAEPPPAKGDAPLTTDPALAAEMAHLEQEGLLKLPKPEKATPRPPGAWDGVTDDRVALEQRRAHDRARDAELEALKTQKAS